MSAYREHAGAALPTPRKVSSLWTLVPWLVPGWCVRWLPPWVTDNVERAVYDGFTRAEWFAEQVRQFEMAARADGWTAINIPEAAHTKPAASEKT